jgi:hypothetical protein
MQNITNQLKSNFLPLKPERTVFNFLINYSKSVNFIKINKRHYKVHLN